MNIVFCIYDGMTALDFVGVYDPVTRLQQMDFTTLEWDVCAEKEMIESSRLEFGVDRIKPDLGEYDILFVPGGSIARDLDQMEKFIVWLQTGEPCEFKISVCTGSLLLGAAGFLNGRSATTHPIAFDRLAEYAEVKDKRVVHDGGVITGRGVSSSLDLGLYVVEVLADAETRKAITKQIDYPYGQDIF